MHLVRNDITTNHVKVTMNDTLFATGIESPTQTSYSVQICLCTNITPIIVYNKFQLPTYYKIQNVQFNPKNTNMKTAIHRENSTLQCNKNLYIYSVSRNIPGMSHYTLITECKMNNSTRKIHIKKQRFNVMKACTRQ